VAFLHPCNNGENFIMALAAAGHMTKARSSFSPAALEPTLQ
jgi:hypothetical protein